MPIEAGLLRHKPYPEVTCPRCGAFPLDPFMRGQVQRSRYGLQVKWWAGIPLPWVGRRPYCAIICYACKEIVGYEEP